jgi:hypothetical protein
MYPVIDQIEFVDTVGDYLDPTTKRHEVVATISTTLYWREIISSVLPSGHNGLVVVFENPCSPSFTYQIK